MTLVSLILSTVGWLLIAVGVWLPAPLGFSVVTGGVTLVLLGLSARVDALERYKEGGE